MDGKIPFLIKDVSYEIDICTQNRHQSTQWNCSGSATCLEKLSHFGLKSKKSGIYRSHNVRCYILVDFLPSVKYKALHNKL